MTDTTALAIPESQTPALFGTSDPLEVIERASRVATALAKVVNDRKLYAVIQGRKFPTVEGWTLLGGMVGVFAHTEWVKPVRDDNGQVRGYHARVVARTLGGIEVGAAEAMCMRGESQNWNESAKDYALMSMAQTRATSKAMGNPLRWVFKLAGYEGASSEEMDGVRPTGEIPIEQASTASQEAVQQSTGVLAVPSPAPVEVVAEPTSPSAGPTTGSATGDGGGGPAPDGASVPPPPQTPANAVPVAPLSGANVSRRLGPGRSISPVRRNVTTVAPVQGAEKPATEPEAVPAPAGPTEPILAQPAPPALTDEPVLPQPIDEGQQVYLNTLRGDLRVRTAALYRVNVLLDNVKRGLESKEPNEVPPATPSDASDDALGRLIDRDFPGRKLANLGEAELQNRLELVEANLAAKRKVLTERGIGEE